MNSRVMDSKGQVGQGDIMSKIMLIVAVPLAIIVGLLIFSTFQTSAGTTVALTVNNETFNVTTDPLTYTVNKMTTSDFVRLTSVTCYSDDGETALADTACNISDASAGDVNISTAIDSGDEAVNYDYIGGEIGATLSTTSGNTYSGFNLAAVLPIVLAAVAVLSLVIGVFGFRR